MMTLKPASIPCVVKRVSCAVTTGLLNNCQFSAAIVCADNNLALFVFLHSDVAF